MLYFNREPRGKEVAIMKGLNVSKTPRRKMTAMMPGKQSMMLRRSANRNAHTITHHGKVRVGRKGRTG